MNIKEFWKKRTYWQKGGILGFLFGCVSVIFFTLLRRFITFMVLPSFYYLFLLVVAGIVIGIVTGFVVRVISERCEWYYKLSTAKKFGIIGFLAAFIWSLFLSIIVVFNPLLFSQINFWVEIVLMFCLFIGLYSLFLGKLLDIFKERKLLNLKGWLIYWFIWFISFFIMLSIMFFAFVFYFIFYFVIVDTL